MPKLNNGGKFLNPDLIPTYKKQNTFQHQNLMQRSSLQRDSSMDVTSRDNSFSAETTMYNKPITGVTNSKQLSVKELNSW